jgi:plastocyanin/mono/diheme cytochrome c family protein
MTHIENFARATLLFIIIGLPLTITGYQQVLHPMLQPYRVIHVAAWAPEAGGFSPSVIQVDAGETVTLRFMSMDVTHGVAIGSGLDADLGFIDPGEQGDITLTFDTPGTYTYYCTTWCSKDHWRMRGVIEVRDPDNPNALPPAQPDPIIQALVEAGVNIDARHMSGDLQPETEAIFSAMPSVERGKTLITSAVIPSQLHDSAWQQSNTPNDAVMHLQTANPHLSLDELRDITAYLWSVEPATPDTVRQYELNCAACHGESGFAEGPAAPFTAEVPSAFADPAYMFTMRSDVLYAKIRRGGMGTDMPNFGTLFTPEETHEMVDYLWQLLFEADTQIDDKATH